MTAAPTHQKLSYHTPSHRWVALARSEFTKLRTLRSLWILALVTVLGTWLMTWPNSAQGVGLEPDDPRLFSTEPIPLDYLGFEMVGFGYLLVVAAAALWAGSEYGDGRPVRTTLLATPARLRVFWMKALLLTSTVGALAFLTMWGTIVITHVVGQTEIDPWALTPGIWAHLVGVSLAWICTALITFSIGVIARSAVWPLMLVTPLVIGVSDFLAGIWEGAKYLPVAAGSALYSPPGTYLAALPAAVVLVSWAAALLAVAARLFVRRDL